MMTLWRALGFTALAACLIVCRPAGGRNRAVPVKGSDAGPPKSAAPAAAAPASASGAPDAARAPSGEPVSKPARTLSPAACAQLRRRVEQQLTAAQRCKGTDQCIATFFEYAFRPCGMSVRKGAKLDDAAADAKRYQEGCHPVIHPVRCAHLPRPLCEGGRCILAAPAAN